MKKQSLSILITLIALSFGVHAQSYVHDWPVENLQPSAETLRQLEHQQDDIPYYLQNRSFRDTTYDTTTWQTLEDIEYLYVKALGVQGAKYCANIEILDDESFIIPWYKYGGDGLHITKVDSMGEEVYTNVYDNISAAVFNKYRKDTILEFVGKFEINSKRRFGILQYSLNTNDTISVSSFGKVTIPFIDDAINTYQLDSINYILSTSSAIMEDYIYIINKTNLVDSIEFEGFVKKVFSNSDSIYIIDRYGEVYLSNDGVVELYHQIVCDWFSNGHFYDDYLYFLNSNSGIIKLNKSFEQIYFAQISEPGFGSGDPIRLLISQNNELLAAAGVHTYNWFPIEEDQSIGLYQLNENGVYLNKLYIGGANFNQQSVYELKNGDYLFIANGDENPTGNGTIFLMRMKPWTNGVGVQNLNKRDELSVYPNPAQDFLKHNIEGLYYYSIYNLNGQLIAAGTNKNKQINIDQLHAGGHLLIIRQNNRRFSKFFIKN